MDWQTVGIVVLAACAVFLLGRMMMKGGGCG